MNIGKSLEIVKGKLLMIKKLLKNDEENGHSSSYEMQKEDFEAIETLLTAYEKEKEKNKKAIKYCKEKSTFQTFEDFELQNVLETYINRLKHRILDILEE